MRRIIGAQGVLSLLLVAWAQSAQAHILPAEATGLSSGVLHPFSGLDHVIAMVAVGLWGAQLGAPTIWILPVVFPLMMAFGGLIGFLGVSLPGTEVGIALSMIVLGGAVMLRARPQLVPVIAVVAFFAIFHGYAHGMELPRGESALFYSVGFVLATAFLHLIGIAIGLIYRATVENREFVTETIGRSGTGQLTF
jgi:urease accessory protein